MEMDLVKENHHDTNDEEDGSPEQSVSQENSEICDEFYDPEVSPRVGEEYQVEVPPLLLKSDINWLQSYKEVEIQDNDLNFFVGMPVQVMWISEEIHSMERKLRDDSVEKCNKNEVLKAESFKDDQIGDDAKPKIEAMEMATGSTIKVSKAAADLGLPKKPVLATNQKHNINGCYLVPGVSSEPWSSIEEGSFLLGLYIFGKNLVLVKKFVGSKQMGDILLFYYGRFYRSEKYRRWSECRKARGRKCIYGQRLFKGWRLQELVSRLLLLVAEDCKNALMEVTKAFGDGKMSFEEYVFSLNATVGSEAFVEAVGVGKGKQDLTGFSMDPLKSNHVVASLRPEIPIGKACSALTPLEIVNYLTGDFRLSKARSSDLFWEAVWPRLLARGWHSEQSSNVWTVGTKHSLVFLVPGIKKFSRRKLVRGNHYFDSVRDVLGKVALDPGLLDLDNIADKGCNIKEENGWNDDSKVDQEDFPSQQRHCYLKPRTPVNTDIMKFTIVDTSLANGASKVRELRSLPVDLLSVSSSRSYSENNDLHSSNESMEEFDFEEDRPLKKAETAKTSQGLRRNKDQKVYSNGHCSPSDVSNQVLPVSERDSTDSPLEVLKEHISVPFNVTQPHNGIMHQLSQKPRTEKKRKPTNVTKKHRRLNTFGSKCTSNISVPSKPKEEDACYSKDDPATSKNILPSAADPSREKSSSSFGCSPISSLDGTPKGIKLNQSRALIDLNLPVPLDSEIDEPVTMEMREGQLDQTNKEPDNPCVVKTSEVPNVSDQQLQMNARRVSSRNGPPTTRALEARALGLFDVRQKRKSKDPFLEESSMMKPPRRARQKVRPTENLGISIEKFKIEDRAVVSLCNGNSNSSNSNSNSEVLSKLET